MPFATYNGDQEARELWSVKFPKGVAVEVAGPLATKCRHMAEFTVADDTTAPIVADTDSAQVAALGVVAEPAVVEAPEIAPRKRGRPRKAS